MHSLNVLVVGTGMYVCGRGTDGFGTIMPAISEWVREGNQLNSLTCVGTSAAGGRLLSSKLDQLRAVTGVHLNAKVFPNEGGPDPLAYRALLSQIPRPACAIVAVPDDLHYQVVKDCLDQGLHVLVVKPFTALTSEAVELVEIAKKKELYGAVEFHKRWDRSNMLLRDLFKSGQLGDPLYSRVEYSQRKSIPLEAFRAWSMRTTILQYLGVHYVDAIRFITGALPKRVIAVGQKKWLVRQGLDAFDSIQAMIEWEIEPNNKFMQIIIVNWIDPETTSAMSDQKLNLVGTRGRYEADQKERGIVFTTDTKPTEHLNPDFCRPYNDSEGKMIWKGYGIDSICTFLGDVDNLSKGKIALLDLSGDFRPTFSEAIISTAVIEHAHKSLYSASEWCDIPSRWEED